MTTPVTSSTSNNGATSSVQGLASGIQWQDLIDQLIQVDTTNQITPITDRITADGNKQSAWTSFGTAVSTLQTTLKGLTDGTAFNSLVVNAGASGSTGRTLVTATATSAAQAGTYGVQVLSTAAAQQLSGNVVSDPTSALGIAGQFMVAGKVVSLTGTDSLDSVRDKINALNTGTTPSHISASVLYSGTAAARLVLTSDVGGSAGLDLRDVRSTSSDPSMLTQLGFISGTAVTVSSDGAVRSAGFSSATQTIGTLTSGVTAYPPATTIMVNGRSVSVDVKNQSLTDIAAAINAQSANSASVETVTTNGVTTYDLKISGTVAASAASGSQQALDLIGATHGTTDAVQQTVSTSNVLEDGTSATATASTLLLGLNSGGAGAQSGDTFTISGMKPDGVTSVSLTETVDGTKTVGDMLADISAAFSASGRSVTASIVGGKIQLSDDAGGDSGLSFSISANNESGVADPIDGGNVSFGATSITAAGRARQLSAGADAKIMVNGVLITRNTNAISDAITGVTLNLQQAEVGTTIPVTVSLDTSKAVNALQNMATAYNTVESLVSSSTAAGGALQYDSSMRSAFNSIKNTLLNNLTGLPSGATFNHAALVGVTLDATGVLSVDTNALTQALNINSAAVQALFQTNGVATGTGLSYLTSSTATASGSYDIQITSAATTASTASSASNFVYAAGASTDTMTVGDSFSGKSTAITLATGDTPTTVAAKLNAAFLSQGVRLTAATSAGVLSITGLDYGSSAKFTVAYSSSDGNDMAGQLGIASGTVANGLDVQGTFSSGTTTYAATGKGQSLVGNTGTPVSGLMVLYNGATNTGTGHIDFTDGIGGLMSNVAAAATASDGTVASQTAALTADVTTQTQRQTDTQARLDAKRAALVAQYTAMETALSKIQADGNYLTQQINSIQGLQSSSK
ncbi:MAG TPA: flagellar filament capping protein FliD [Gemmatimonadaceae bacterium]|jgi:flagellar hook-associated protein 2